MVVLIDEYDAPMLDVAHEQEQLDALRNIMRNFFSPLKFCEAKLRFVFLTGITKFSQVSIFSELNNITLISMDKDYAGICGITQEELLTQMQEDIDMLAQSQDLTREATIAKLKEHYDGYHLPRYHRMSSILTVCSIALQKKNSAPIGSVRAPLPISSIC